MTTIRKPAVAGSFYPAKKEALAGILQQFLQKTQRQKEPEKMRACIVPHAGYSYSGQVAAYGYALLTARTDITKVILLGPSHYHLLDHAVADSHDFWQTPLGKVSIVQQHGFQKASRIHEKEHCLEVQVPFLQCVLHQFTLLPLVMGEGSPHLVARQIIPLLDPTTLLIISSDLSHYHPALLAETIDHETITGIITGNETMLTQEGEACGMIPVLTLMAIAQHCCWKAELLKYMHSGMVTGEQKGVVGYASIAFYQA